MSSIKEDPTQKKGKPWSDIEYDILMRMTREQLELEEQDRSRTISWTEHWKNVSSFLKEQKYARTEGACRTYWTRIIESQEINAEVTEEANGGSSASDMKISATNTSDGSYSSKRYICSEEARTPRSKRLQMGDRSCQGPVERYHVS